MNVRRWLVSLAIACVWLATPAPARAHRLDEYLQATRITIDAERVGLEVDLTAGVEMASEVFAWIDTNRDGQISSVEGEAYARQVLRSVVLSVDGRTLPITLVDFRFPQFGEMSRGVGTIHVRATADLSAGGAERHHMSFVNSHRPERSVYLVNALVPTDPGIQLGDQQRDRAQHGLTLDYTVGASAPWARTWSLLAALGMAGVLGMTRRPRTYPRPQVYVSRRVPFASLPGGIVSALDSLPGHELHGTRVVGQWPSDELVDLWGKVCSGVVKQGFVIEYRDLEPPRTGIFDGLRIVIDPDVGFEMQCFLLLHLFGHSVQWVAPSLEHKLADLQDTHDRPHFMQVLHAYELEAAGFGMQLMHQVGVTALDQWYSDFVETDWRYVERFYQTDRLPEWKSCVVTGCPLIVPTPIPELRHHEVQVRFAF